MGRLDLPDFHWGCLVLVKTQDSGLRTLVGCIWGRNRREKGRKARLTATHVERIMHVYRAYEYNDSLLNLKSFVVSSQIVPVMLPSLLDVHSVWWRVESRPSTSKVKVKAAMTFASNTPLSLTTH
eukprot:scaffold138_cov78-Skeletonema_marinoi.AAC.2